MDGCHGFSGKELAKLMIGSWGWCGGCGGF